MRAPRTTVPTRIVFGVGLLTALFFGACSKNDSGGGKEGGGSDSSSMSASKPAEDPVKRGEYIVTVGGCNDCHTPWKMGANGQPEPDMTKMLQGHPAEMALPDPPAAAGPWIWGGAATNTAYWGPWGVSFAQNITPDSLTGIGSWSEETFMAALRTGKHMGKDRPILPPMPWPWYGKMTDDDLKSVYAYLRTIPAISNKVPTPIPPKGGAPAM